MLRSKARERNNITRGIETTRPTMHPRTPRSSAWLQPPQPLWRHAGSGELPSTRYCTGLGPFCTSRHSCSTGWRRGTSLSGRRGLAPSPQSTGRSWATTKAEIVKKKDITNNEGKEEPKNNKKTYQPAAENFFDFGCLNDRVILLKVRPVHADRGALRDVGVLAEK